ncbi:MAG TPA: PqiC family protein [Candidatus Binataceae bacterium]|nr:PqiC family protein [Candidatus Binataceae bacterium]
MSTNSLTRLVSAILIPIAFAACGTSAQPHFYALTSTAAPAAAQSAPIAVLVGPVSVPAAVDRPQFVVQKASNRVDIDEFNRWSAPLNDSIARVIASDLSTQLGTPNVATAPLANFAPDYRVTIDVQRFDTIEGQGVTVEAVWVARKSDGKTRTGRTIAHEATQGNGFDAIAAAHSRALAQVSADIAEAIRSEASATQ